MRCSQRRRCPTIGALEMAVVSMSRKEVKESERWRVLGLEALAKEEFYTSFHQQRP